MLKAALLALFSRNKKGSRKLDPFLASKEQFIETVYNEEDGTTITIKFACSCGTTVRRLDDGFFACGHCDRPCYAGNCKACKTLHSLDLWAQEAQDGNL